MMVARRRRLLLSFAMLALTACAHSSLVMLPNADGTRGQVTITKRGATAPAAVVTQPNSRANLGSGRPTVQPLGRGLNAREAALLRSLPPAAKSFTFYFLEGTTTLTPASVPMLEALRAEVARRPGADVQVTGHTDTVGGSDDNDLLSRKRASEILLYLAGQGFDRSAMKAVGRGERELKQRTGDNVSSAVNRRVEVIVR